MRALPVVALLLALGPTAHAVRLRKPAHGFQMRVDPFTVHPGQDLEVCEYTRLPNRKPIDVNGFEVRMPEGAHHFVVWSYDGDVQDDRRFPAGPVPSFGCAGVAPDEIIPSVLIPIQTPNSRFHFPPGIGLRLEAHKQVLLNPHLRNPEPTDLTPDIRFNFYKARKGSVRHYAQGLIAGNTGNINIPAGGEQTLTAEWTAPVTVNLVYLATHQHRLGSYANLELVDANGTPRMFYENHDWQHPYSYWPSQPIRLEQGQKMRITCRWQNTDDHVVRFGPKTTDEMCFILGFYYRDDGDTTPVSPIDACFPAKSGLVCLGAPAVAGG